MVQKIFFKLIESAGVYLECWDMTTEIGIPAFRAVLYELGRDGEANTQPWISRPQFGFGCHLNPEVALSRAITEASQSRLVLIAGSRDDLAPHHYQPPSDGNRARILIVNGGSALKKASIRTKASLASDSCEIDIETILARLKGVGLTQVVLLDLTDPLFNVPVVRAVCPGLGRLVAEGGSEFGIRSRPDTKE